MSETYGSAKLVTTEEVRDIEGKKRSLGALLKNPNPSIAQLQPLIDQLHQLFAAVLDCKCVPFSVNDRIKVELGLMNIRKIEDILIRVILRGENVAEVTEQYRQQPT